MNIRSLKWLKKVLIPHDANDHKPHLLREVGVSVLLFTSVFLLGSSAGSSFLVHRTVLGASIAASVLIDLTNESRIAMNEPPLVRSQKLDQAAQLKGEDMANKQYFSHDSPDGVTPWHWFKEVGYNFLYAGENLAINFTDSSDVEKAWLNSPSHRENILNIEFREIGIATVKGVYKDYPTIYIVQMFGTPAYSATKGDTKVMEVRKPLKKATTVQSEKLAIENIKASTTTEVLGSVKGAETNSTSSTSSAASSTIEEVLMTQQTAIVKNTDIEKIPANVIISKKYSTWYERVLFNMSYYIDFIYKGIILLIAFTLVTMVLIEIRKQHYRHILYGISLLLLLSAFLYINQGF